MAELGGLLGLVHPALLYRVLEDIKYPYESLNAERVNAKLIAVESQVMDRVSAFLRNGLLISIKEMAAMGFTNLTPALYYAVDRQFRDCCANAVTVRRQRDGMVGLYLVAASIGSPPPAQAPLDVLLYASRDMYVAWLAAATKYFADLRPLVVSNVARAELDGEITALELFVATAVVVHHLHAYLMIAQAVALGPAAAPMVRPPVFDDIGIFASPPEAPGLMGFYPENAVAPALMASEVEPAVLNDNRMIAAQPERVIEGFEDNVMAPAPVAFESQPPVIYQNARLAAQPEAREYFDFYYDVATASSPVPSEVEPAVIEQNAMPAASPGEVFDFFPDNSTARAPVFFSDLAMTPAPVASEMQPAVFDRNGILDAEPGVFNLFAEDEMTTAAWEVTNTFDDFAGRSFDVQTRVSNVRVMPPNESTISTSRATVEAAAVENGPSSSLVCLSSSAHALWNQMLQPSPEVYAPLTEWPCSPLSVACAGLSTPRRVSTPLSSSETSTSESYTSDYSSPSTVTDYTIFTPTDSNSANSDCEIEFPSVPPFEIELTPSVPDLTVHDLTWPEFDGSRETELEIETLSYDGDVDSDMSD